MYQPVCLVPPNFSIFLFISKKTFLTIKIVMQMERDYIRYPEISDSRHDATVDSIKFRKFFGVRILDGELLQTPLNSVHLLS